MLPVAPTEQEVFTDKIAMLTVFWCDQPQPYQTEYTAAPGLKSNRSCLGLVCLGSRTLARIPDPPDRVEGVPERRPEAPCCGRDTMHRGAIGREYPRQFRLDAIEILDVFKHVR